MLMSTGSPNSLPRRLRTAPTTSGHSSTASTNHLRNRGEKKNWAAGTWGALLLEELGGLAGGVVVEEGAAALRDGVRHHRVELDVPVPAPGTLSGVRAGPHNPGEKREGRGL